MKEAHCLLHIYLLDTRLDISAGCSLDHNCGLVLHLAFHCGFRLPGSTLVARCAGVCVHVHVCVCVCVCVCVYVCMCE